jgi:protein-tyrosine phosphatase
VARRRAAAGGRDEEQRAGTGSVSVRVLFVCMGNICRSPTAEAVMRHLVAAAGLQDVIELDSAGTRGWHAGQPPDRRARAAARRRGIGLAGAARQVSAADFARFDLVVAMDEQNLRDLLAIAPPGTAHKIRKLAELDVPDPYYGGPDGFDTVSDVVTAGCARLLAELPAR